MSSGLLTGALQASFVVESELLALWGVEDLESAATDLGLPPGAITSIPIALPDPEAGCVVAGAVEARVIPAVAAAAALADLDASGRTGLSDSLTVWSQLATEILSADGGAIASRDDGRVAELTSVLPTAGHAALATDAVTIWSAESAVTAFRNAVAVNHEGVAAGVEAVLRPYQRAGAAWLRAARGHGGAVLADEMGLGKTVQAIAVLAAHTDRAHPIVCPTTLVGNWVRELAKFAPEVRTLSYFGTDRQTLLNTAAPGTVVITSYGVLRSDADALSRHDWDVVVLDEAQQIKNPDALAARAARDLPARLRVAMTGTPVENRLDELWSLLAFTNPGVLGTRARFRRRFAGSIERGGSAAAAVRLHEIIAPHILRRLKRDVAPELPDKIDATVVCPLSDEQHRLYRASVEGAFAAGLGSGQSRRGRILALLTRLKQICNHPELVTPTGQPLAGRSGKLDRATEILAEVVDAGDRALVFTQFRETGELLGRHLAENVTGSPVPFLHGGLTASRREELVDQFQNDATSSPILVLSLRAAGFGLNLTEATHVMHYDRWWNPAVEDQASDRAHRHRTDPHRHSPYPGHRTLHRRSHRRAARRETGPRGSGTGRDHQPGHRPGHTQ